MNDLLKKLRENKYLPMVLILGAVLFFLSLIIIFSQSPINQRGAESPNPKNSNKPSPTAANIIPTFDPKKQEQGEQEFTREQDAIHTNYPWIDKFPIRTSEYFVYFNVGKKSFIGLLYPTNISKNREIYQVVFMKTAIRKAISALNINPLGLTYKWSIKPESNPDNLVNKDAIEKDPNLLKKENISNGSIKYTLKSSNDSRANIFIFDKSGTMIFKRVVIDNSTDIRISDFTESYGAAPVVFKGSNTYGSQFQSYIYANYGIAFIANPQVNEVSEIQLFKPSKIEDYIKNYGDDIPAQP